MAFVATSKRFEIEKYGFGSYDDFFCLRPSWLLIAAIVFSCRSLIALGLLGIFRAAGASSQFHDLMDTSTLWQGSLAGAPALLVLYALGARVPSAPAFVKWIW